MNFLKHLLLVLAAGAGAHGFSAERPNIIVIMGDDMDYSDIGCYGSEIATPNLDALAKGGVRFTQFYNTARCCPTRASRSSRTGPPGSERENLARAGAAC